jgi:hypothetical protein
LAGTVAIDGRSSTSGYPITINNSDRSLGVLQLSVAGFLLYDLSSLSGLVSSATLDMYISTISSNPSSSTRTVNFFGVTIKSGVRTLLSG